MAANDIATPRGSIIINEQGKAELKWNSNFRQKWATQYSDAQKFMDNAVLTTCNGLYVPQLTGMLINSGILGTDIGSGKVSWIAPYAKRQYYRGRREGESQMGPLKGRYWFERAKATHKTEWIAGARKIAGGGAKK